MTESNDLDALLAALRSPAQPDELADESVAVHAMSNAFHTAASAPSKGALTMITTNRFLSSRRARVAILVTVGVIGVGSVAAAGPAVLNIGGSDPHVVPAVDDSTTTSTTSTTTSTTSTTMVPETTMPPETTLPPETTVAPGTPVVPTTQVDDPNTDFNENDCADGNHGKTVSSVAQTPGRTSSDVRDAAHSSCGKDDGEIDDQNEVEGPDDSVDKQDSMDQQQQNDGQHDSGKSGQQPSSDHGSSGKGNSQSGNSSSQSGKGSGND
jgi:hypothetical protein